MPVKFKYVQTLLGQFYAMGNISIFNSENLKGLSAFVLCPSKFLDIKMRILLFSRGIIYKNDKMHSLTEVNKQIDKTYKTIVLKLSNFK